MNRSQAKELIEKYNEGVANASEKAWVENWYLEESRKYKFPDDKQNFVHLKEEIWLATMKTSGLAAKPVFKPIKIWSGIAAAVAILIAFVAGFYFYSGLDKKAAKTAAMADVAPGGHKAILTLADGKKIVLNDLANGEVFVQPGIRVRKSEDGKLVYEVLEQQNPGENKINTIATPEGGQYTVVLSDGTKVMLNSASSLSFPASFKDGDRVVELKGEAYFEVAKQKKHFKVVSTQQTVEVLGTHFNINAYADEEKIKTTLLEGSVKVANSMSTTIIEPGEQAVVDRTGTGAIVKHHVNIAKETAWINGVFSFEGDDLKSVMRQVSRWYDVNVIYTGTLSDEKYFGEISRSSKLSEVFKILELNNVQFELIGKTVKVSYNQRSPAAINPKK
ncbi:fec operon regulator FecR [compost metagenome]